MQLTFELGIMEYHHKDVYLDAKVAIPNRIFNLSISNWFRLHLAQTNANMARMEYVALIISTCLSCNFPFEYVISSCM